MKNQSLFRKIKIFILSGYSILIILGVLGAVWIYNELVVFSNKNPYNESKELQLVSNILVNMYEAESVLKTIFTHSDDSEKIKHIYDSIKTNIDSSLDSLHNTTTQLYIKSSTDTINILLEKKALNVRQMLSLLDSIHNLPNTKEIYNTYITKKQYNRLNDMFKYHFDIASDTSYYIKNKKKFLDRVADVFVARTDSTKIVLKPGSSKVDSVFYDPVDLLTDSVIQQIQSINNTNIKKSAVFTTRLTARQNQMLYYDGMLTSQINGILYLIDKNERRALKAQIDNRQATLHKSAKIVTFIAVGSILIMIAFLFLSYYYINISKLQKIKLEKSHAHIQELLKSRERLMLMISHDIKSPLSSIIANIELMQSKGVSSSNQKDLDNLLNSTDHILGLVNKLLDFYKIEQGKSEINLAPVNLHELFDSVYQIFKPLSLKRNIQLKLLNNIADNTFTHSDSYVLKQILHNLVSNALKFTEHGEIYISADISDDNKSIVFSVKDTGIGIRENELKSIFEEFSRVGTTKHKQQVEGFGLGLAITKKLTEQLQGTINVKSEYGQGSEFIVSIPLRSNHFSINSNNINSYSADKSISANILFIDDDIVLLSVINDFLTAAGAKITVCDNPVKVFELLLQNKYDLIFSDLQMPGSSGKELVKRIRNAGIPHYTNIPIFALSANSAVNKDELKMAGFTEIVEKPVKLSYLVELINTYTNNNIETDAFKINKIQSKGIAMLIEYTREDVAASEKIIDSFIVENNKMLKNMKVALQKNEWETIRTNAHKMLTLMKMIEECEIVHILSRIDNGQQDADEVKTVFPLIENVIEKAINLKKSL